MTGYFDAEAPKWDDNPSRVRLAREVAAAMVAHLGLEQGMIVLDYGAGTGLVSLALLPHVARVVAADRSEGMLETLSAKLARAGITGVTPVRWSAGEPANALPAPDVIVGSMVLHHVRDVEAAARAFFALLPPGGRIGFADLDLEGGAFHGPEMHAEHDGFDRVRLCGTFERAGFADIVFHEAASVTRPTAGGGERTFSVFLMTGVRP